jgi:DHA2 family multidrug resistance protein-like MFS transporter
MSVANQLPDELGARLVEAASLAFTDGLRLTVAIGAVLAIGGAILATVLLRGVPPPSETDGDAEPAAHKFGEDRVDGPLPAPE